ncbi:MAG: hypothetical protein AAFR71_01100 [Pseudomonadota bacterium]
MVRRHLFLTGLFLAAVASSVPVWAADVINVGNTLDGRLFRTDADFSVPFQVEVKKKTGDGVYVGDIKIADRKQTVLPDKPIIVGDNLTISFQLNFGKRVFAPVDGQAVYRADWENQFRNQPASYAAEFTIK